MVAERQSSGRGRRGRIWQSPRGNLYFSVILRPRREVREWPDLSWVLAAAVAEAAAAAGAASVAVKHPNDVVAPGGKLAGLLLETRSASSGSQALVAGIGVNLNLEAAELGEALAGRVVSLRDLTGETVDSGAFLAALCGNMDRWYDCWSSGGPEAALALARERGIAFVGGREARGEIQEQAGATGGGR